MKSEIAQKQYNEKSDEAIWWTWKEVCDRCGKVVHEAGDMIALWKPDTTKEDLCLQCLRKKLRESQETNG